VTHTPDAPAGSYRVSAGLLARPEFRAACAVRDFGTILRLTGKYNGASQDRISSPHEIDHLDGNLYTDRMRPGVTPIPVEQYRGVGSAWAYTTT